MGLLTLCRESFQKLFLTRHQRSDLDQFHGATTTPLHELLAVLVVYEGVETGPVKFRSPLPEDADKDKGEPKDSDPTGKPKLDLDINKPADDGEKKSKDDKSA